MDWNEASGNHLCVEIRDATLAAVEWVGHDLLLRLAHASLFRSEGRAGYDPGTV